MNWTAIFTTVWNAALQFGAGFGSVYLSTGDTKTALAAGIAGLATGQAALHQMKPGTAK